MEEINPLVVSIRNLTYKVMPIITSRCAEKKTVLAEKVVLFYLNNGKNFETVSSSIVKGKLSMLLKAIDKETNLYCTLTITPAQIKINTERKLFDPKGNAIINPGTPLYNLLFGGERKTIDPIMYEFFLSVKESAHIVLEYRSLFSFTPHDIFSTECVKGSVSRKGVEEIFLHGKKMLINNDASIFLYCLYNGVVIEENIATGLNTIKHPNLKDSLHKYLSKGSNKEYTIITEVEDENGYKEISPEESIFVFTSLADCSISDEIYRIERLGIILVRTISESGNKSQIKGKINFLGVYYNYFIVENLLSLFYLKIISEYKSEYKSITFKLKMVNNNNIIISMEYEEKVTDKLLGREGRYYYEDKTIHKISSSYDDSRNRTYILEEDFRDINCIIKKESTWKDGYVTRFSMEKKGKKYRYLVLNNELSGFESGYLKFNTGYLLCYSGRNGCVVVKKKQLCAGNQDTSHCPGASLYYSPALRQIKSFPKNVSYRKDVKSSVKDVKSSVKDVKSSVKDVKSSVKDVKSSVKDVIFAS